MRGLGKIATGLRNVVASADAPVAEDAGEAITIRVNDWLIERYKVGRKAQELSGRLDAEKASVWRKTRQVADGGGC